jgi:capsular exopolysaccharide synthesis family protein
MSAERDKLRTKMSQMSSQLASYHMLKTEANANVELYNTLQGRLREAGIYAGLRSSNIRVVDLARNLAQPSGPHRLLVFLLGALGSCVFALVLSFLREGFRNTVRTPDDVKSWTGLPSLALLPEMKKVHGVAALPFGRANGFSSLWEISSTRPDRAGVEIMKSATAASEAMRDLRTALLHGKRESAPRVILISSSMEGEGKTTVAVNFAIALAQIGRTCLLEGDLRQPCVAQAFKIDSKSGLTDVLQRSMPLGDAVIDVPDVENLSILPCGTPSQCPADALSSSHLLDLLDVLKRHYSFIVIDSPPVIPFSDARFLSCLADEVVLVGRYGVTTRRCMQRTAELLGEVQASVAGVVLNGIDLSSPDYDYYTYGYSRWRGKRAADPQANGGAPPQGKDPDKPGTMSAHA